MEGFGLDNGNLIIMVEGMNFRASQVKAIKKIILIVKINKEYTEININLRENNKI